MKNFIAKLFKGRIISSLIFIGLGLLLILMPDESVNLICKFLFSVILIATGAFHVLLQLFGQKNATVFDLFSGVILIVLGGFLFMNPVLVIKLFPVLLGGFTLADSLVTLKGAFILNRRERGSWVILAFFSIVYLLAGGMLILNPFKVISNMVMAAGYILASMGVLDLFFGMFVFFGVRRAEKLARKREEEAARREAEENVDFVTEDDTYDDWEETENPQVSEAADEASFEDVESAEAETEVTGVQEVEQGEELVLELPEDAAPLSAPEEDELILELPDLAAETEETETEIASGDNVTDHE